MIDNKIVYSPINVAKKIDENIWIFDGGSISMDMYCCKIPFSTRMTVIKLDNGGLWVHSPIKINEEVIKQISKLGDVKYIVGPNKIHYAYIYEWAEHFPDAKVYAAKEIEKRAKAQNIKVKIDEILTDDVPAEWKGQIAQHVFKGSSFMEEVVFYHVASRSLILVDLIENFESEKLSKLYAFFAKLVGVLAPGGRAPLDLRVTFMFGKAKAKNSLNIIKKWDFDNIILAHGKCVFENARDTLNESFKWLSK